MKGSKGSAYRSPVSTAAVTRRTLCHGFQGQDAAPFYRDDTARDRERGSSTASIPKERQAIEFSTERVQCFVAFAVLHEDIETIRTVPEQDSGRVRGAIVQIDEPAHPPRSSKMRADSALDPIDHVRCLQPMHQAILSKSFRERSANSDE